MKRYRDQPPLLDAAETLLQSTIKRVRRVQYPVLDTVQYDWLLHFEKQVPMSGDLIKEKAAISFTALYPQEKTLEKFSMHGRYFDMELRSLKDMEPQVMWI